MGDVELNTKGLDQLLKSLAGKQPQARVGILGAGNSRNDGGQSNAEIGARHEFGDENMPQRSFLRTPITEHLQEAIDSSGAFGKPEMKEVIRSGSVLPWLKKIAVLAEGIVLEAFDTAGFGKWPKWKTPGYMNRSGQILVDTGQLRNSITSEVK